MRAERRALLARADVVGASLRTALTELADTWLAGLLGDELGVTLVAVGGYGRREPALGSDLDLLLLHDGRGDVLAVADRVWYPVWDVGVGLDHAVRTTREALAVARDNLPAALGLLDARHIAGDPQRSADLVAAARDQWRRDAAHRLPALHAAGRARVEQFGELAFEVEPDLREARGGLRDVQALRALAVAQHADPPTAEVRAAYTLLLDVRGELHRRDSSAGRVRADRLVLQEQDRIAAAFGYADADALAAAVSGAGRTISYAGDLTWRRVLAALGGRRWRGSRSGPPWRPIARGVLARADEVALAEHADPASDPVLPLRVAAAAASLDRPIAPYTLTRLLDCPPLPEPWPGKARDELVRLLGAGPGLIAVWEALDQAGLLDRLLPEWRPVRCHPQRNAYHRFTVDRHLVEAVVQAVARCRRVSRPDLLLLAALLHDIGKGQPGDHSESGALITAGVGRRIDLPARDIDVVTRLVRHHLLLAETATRRGLDDPLTLAAVAHAVRDRPTLELLHALTESDAAATGPAAWSDWKAGLVSELVRRTAQRLAGAPPPAPPPLTAAQRRLVARGELDLVVEGGPDSARVSFIAPDQPGLLSRAAGVLALHRLEVRSAVARIVENLALTVFDVAPRYGEPVDWAVAGDDLRRALDGRLDVAAQLARRAPPRRPSVGPPPRVSVVGGATSTATLVEVRAHDSPGLLHRVTAALEGYRLDVRRAHVSTLGAEVVDVFYAPEPGTTGIPAHRWADVERAILAALR